MSDAGRARHRSGDWLQVLVDSAVASSKAARQAAWDAGFSMEEAAAALCGLEMPSLHNGPELHVSDLIILVMEGADPTPRFPKWQFEPALLRYLPVFHDALSSLSHWQRQSFFLGHNDLLDMTPLSALRVGRYRQVLAAAVAANDDY